MAFGFGGGRWPQGVRTRQPDSALVQPGRGAWNVGDGRMEASICDPACHLGQAAGTPSGGSAPPFCRGSCHRVTPGGSAQPSVTPPAHCFSASHSCDKAGVTSRLMILTLTTHPWDVCSTLVCPELPYCMVQPSMAASILEALLAFPVSLAQVWAKPQAP